MNDLKSIKGFSAFTNGIFIGAAMTAFFGFKQFKKRVISFAEIITAYNTNISIMLTREKALVALLDPVIDHLSEDAINEYNNTVEFLELLEFNNISSQLE